MASPPREQYQHFVPQFLLRNFSHPYKPDGPIKGRKYEKGMYPKDKVIRHVDLTLNPPVICEKPIGRILGRVNMYDNPNQPTALQREVEKLLSALEDRASQVFRKITKAHNDKEPGLWITRSERDTVRKFLFILMYRNKGFHDRFNHSTAECYTENDKELVAEYMRKNNIVTPLDVWLEGIKAIINLRMDPDRKWRETLVKQMYPHDALWFWTHVEFSYMAILTPAKDGDEFILTDNAYSVFEGPNNSAVDAESGEVIDTDYTPLHTFAPISPKLMIVLRTAVFPDALEDAHEGVKEMKALHRSMFRVPLESPGSDKVRSLLADLPVTRARNSYSTIVDGREQLVGDGPWKRNSGDRFCFTIFPVKRRHVDMINGIFLDSCTLCTSVVFESREAFARTLEWYLTAPCDMGKIMGGKHKEMRRKTLFKLEAVSRSLGSEKETKWVDLEEGVMYGVGNWRSHNLDKMRNLARLMKEGPETLDNMIRELSKDIGGPPSSKFWDAYTALGGSWDTLIEDFDQAELMQKFRIKIDVWSSGVVDEITRQRNRDLVESAYLRLPPRRVWLYIKFVRCMLVADPDGKVDGELTRREFDGPEDTIAQVQHLVKPDYLCPLLWRTHINQRYVRRHDQVDIWTSRDDDEAGLMSSSGLCYHLRG
ncbi:hypothetical protein QBC40DRAFT_188240 [Triangularia verruculosa]|uniref:DUF4238 domain-containing protein n=1 Tax=Triangularia verruculosa TaxID=2587418 RepID=A0AAN6X5D1_9PEZI|nr:hypothetical protein QBC40DRAFT_188240 [Triangularia verruculosa]